MANYTPGIVPGLRPPADTAPEFTAVAYGHGLNVAVNLPEEVSGWFGEQRHVSVLGLLDGAGIQATLAPRGGGRHRLYLNNEMRSAVGIEVGDRVTITLWRDPDPRDPELPEDVRTAFDAAAVLESFLAWPPSHRREYLVAIEDAKRPETRWRRIEQTIAAVEEGRES